MAPCALMKKGTKTKSRSPAATCRATKSGRQEAGVPSSSSAGMRSECFQDTAWTVWPVRAPSSAATRRRPRWAAGSSEPLSIRAMVIA